MKRGIYLAVAIAVVVALLALILPRGASPTATSSAAPTSATSVQTTPQPAPPVATSGTSAPTAPPTATTSAPTTSTPAATAAQPASVESYEANYTFLMRVFTRGVEARVEGWLVIGESGERNYTYGRLRFPTGDVEIYGVAYNKSAVVYKLCAGGVCQYDYQGLFPSGSRNATTVVKGLCQWLNYTGVMNETRGFVELSGLMAPFRGRGNFTEHVCMAGRLLLTYRLEVDAVARFGAPFKSVMEVKAVRVGAFNETMYRRLAEELRSGPAPPAFADLLESCYAVYAAKNGTYLRTDDYPADADVVYVVADAEGGAAVAERIADDLRRGLTVYLVTFGYTELQRLLPNPPDGLYVARCPQSDVLDWLRTQPAGRAEITQSYARVVLK